MSHPELKNIITIYDFGRNVGGISPIASKVSISLASKYTVYYCAAESPDFVAKELKKSIHYVKLSRVAEEGRSEAIRAISSISNFHAGYRLYRLLKSIDPRETIIHIHGWGMALSGIVLWVARRLAFKIVYTAHDYSIFCPNGVYFDFARKEDCRLRPLSWACVKSNCDKKGKLVKTQRLIRKFFDNYIWQVNKSICQYIYVSEVVNDIFNQYYPLCKKNVNLRNPVEEVNLSGEGEKDLFICVGRITEEKGVIFLARTMRDLGIPITFCGGGELEESLINIWSGVHVTGWLPRADLNTYYRRAKVLVLPSLWRETSALIVDEAVQMGVPCVVPSGTGAAEKIIATGAGIVFERGSESDLKEKIVRMQDPLFYATCIENCIKSRSYWNFYGTYTKEIEEIYKGTVQCVNLI